MSATICLDIPREVFHATRLTPAEMKRELAVHLYERSKLSFGKARELAGMTVWDFQDLLGEREINVHYDVKEYEEDLETLRRLGLL